MELPSDEANEEFRKEQERLDQRKTNDLRKVLSSVEGRRIIWDLLSDCGVFCGSFNTNNAAMSFQEGRRDIGLKLIIALNRADKNAFARLQSEYLSEALKKK